MRLTTATLMLALAAPVLFADDTCVTYTYCETWGGLCATGTQQSPIANNAVGRKEDPRLGELKRYDATLVTGVTVYNTRTTLKVKTVKKVETKYNGETITLDEFHFHTPAEHRLDVWLIPGPKMTVAELHLVHKDGNKAVVLAVPIYLGASNPALAALRQLGKPDACQSRSTTTNIVKMADLLPADLDRYITYKGSLTTPPCDQEIRFVLLPGISATQAELDYIKVICNARPVQYNPNEVTFRVPRH